MERSNISGAGPWESLVGYSRAVRAGNIVCVSGTVAPASPTRPSDPYQQTIAALRVIETALRAVGVRLSDVVRTRMYVTDITHWEQVGKAHAEFFGEVRPATTMVEVRRLIEPDILVEIEADAIVG